MADVPATGPKVEQPELDVGHERPARAAQVRYWQIVLIALVAIVFTALWLAVYGFLNTAIWSNTFVTAHRWTTPVGAVVFSMLVGLTVKYRRAPTVIHGDGVPQRKRPGEG